MEFVGTGATSEDEYMGYGHIFRKDQANEVVDWSDEEFLSDCVIYHL